MNSDRKKRKLHRISGHRQKGQGNSKTGNIFFARIQRMNDPHRKRKDIATVGEENSTLTTWEHYIKAWEGPMILKAEVKITMIKMNRNKTFNPDEIVIEMLTVILSLRSKC